MFFANASEQVTAEWPDPAGLGPNVNDAMSDAEKAQTATVLQGAQSAAARARRLAERGNEIDAVRVWQELLGPLFPTR